MAQPMIQEHALARAAKDPAFRQALLSNPRAVLAREYHVHLPEEVVVRVLEEAPNKLSLELLPREEAMRELSDAELEVAAGGAGADEDEMQTFLPKTTL